MLSEKSLMCILELEPQFSLQFLGMRGHIRPVPIAKTVLATIAFVIHVIFFVQNIQRVDSVMRFVFDLLWVTSFVTTMVYLSTLLSDDNLIYKETVEIDDEMDTHIAAERDWWLLLMAALYPCVAGSKIAYTWLDAKWIYLFPICTIILVSFSTLSVAVKKGLISKRLKHLRTADMFKDRVEDTIRISRRLLELDNTLNSTYAPLAAAYIIYSFQDLLVTLYCIWAKYGAHLEVLFDPIDSYGSAILYVVFECVIGITLASSSSMIAEEVGKI